MAELVFRTEAPGDIIALHRVGFSLREEVSAAILVGNIKTDPQCRTASGIDFINA